MAVPQDFLQQNPTECSPIYVGPPAWMLNGWCRAAGGNTPVFPFWMLIDADNMTRSAPLTSTRGGFVAKQGKKPTVSPRRAEAHQ